MRFFALLLILVTFTKAANITCNFDSGTPWPSCFNFTITPLSSADEEITILGQPSNYIDIKTSRFDFNKKFHLNYIPTKIFKYFPNLMHFSAANASINALVTDNFNNCENMNSIYIIDNSISHVPARFASGCHFLVHLSLNYNKIRTIDEKAFEGLESLKTLLVRSNQISCIPALLFKSNWGLDSINFSSNKITALHPAIFKDLTQLHMIRFDSNEISYIPNLFFNQTETGSIGLIQVKLFDNPVIAIDPEFLTTIFLSYTSSIDVNFYSSDPNAPSCIDIKKYPESELPYYIGSADWVKTHVALKYRTTCYKNFNAEMASNSLVNCGCGSE